MVSVVVCTYNRAPVLKIMLESFFRQENLNDIEYELIVVDNNSREETKSVISEYLHNSKCRYVFEARQGLSIARNRGIAESRGDIVAFLDDDVIVDKNWLKRLADCFEETVADVVGGRVYLLFEKELPDWLEAEFRIFLGEVDFGDRRLIFGNGDGFGLWGCNLSVRKVAFEMASGFDERLGRRGSELIAGEDTELLKRIAFLGKKIVYEPGAVVRHIIGPDRLEWDYFLRHSAGIGKTKALLEPSCKTPWRMLRVGSSLLNYAVSIRKLIGANLYNSSSYEKKLAEWTAMMHKNHLLARWKTFWKAL